MLKKNCLENMESLYKVLGKSNVYLRWVKMQSSLILNDFNRCGLLKTGHLSLGQLMIGVFP